MFQGLCAYSVPLAMSSHHRAAISCCSTTVCCTTGARAWSKLLQSSSQATTAQAAKASASDCIGKRMGQKCFDITNTLEPRQWSTSSLQHTHQWCSQALWPECNTESFSGIFLSQREQRQTTILVLSQCRQRHGIHASSKQNALALGLGCPEASSSPPCRTSHVKPRSRSPGFGPLRTSTPCLSGAPDVGEGRCLVKGFEITTGCSKSDGTNNWDWQGVTCNAHVTKLKNVWIRGTLSIQYMVQPPAYLPKLHCSGEWKTLLWRSLWRSFGAFASLSSSRKIIDR